MAAERVRVNEEVRLKEEEEKATRIAEVKLQRVASSADVTVEQAKEMVEFGITKEGDKFLFGVYRYDRLEDAVNYARKQSEAPRTDQGAGSTAVAISAAIIAAANTVLRNPTIENSLSLLALRKEDVNVCGSWSKPMYQIRRNGQTVNMAEHEVISYAQNIAWPIAGFKDIRPRNMQTTNAYPITKSKGMIIAAAHAVRGDPSLQNSLYLLRMNLEDVSHLTESAIIRRAQELAKTLTPP